MTRLSVLATAMLLMAGCATPRGVATAEQVRQTKEGGTILLHHGDGPQAAARYALATMEYHCKGPFEIVEIAKVGTGQSITRGSASDSSWTSTTAQIAGTSLTYICRNPQDTDMNVQVATLASQDLLGNACGSARECGVYACTASKASASGMICTAPDGSIPFARKGEACEFKACIAPYTCYRTNSTSTASASSPGRSCLRSVARRARSCSVNATNRVATDLATMSSPSKGLHDHALDRFSDHHPCSPARL